MSKISKIFAREILDSNGNPTVEATVVLEDGVIEKSSFPSGKSSGENEAKIIKDGDQNRFLGLGVLRSVDAINTQIAPKLVGLESNTQQQIDKIMMDLDGTHKKEKLGANSILPVSQAVAKASAKSNKMPLFKYLRQFISQSKKEHRMPTPMFNFIEGGVHAENNLNFQEFLVIPATFHTLSESLEIGITVFNKIREFLIDNNQSVLSADEGGFAPPLATNEDALKMLKAVIEITEYKYLNDIFLGLDISAHNMVENKKYIVKDRHGQLGHDELIEIYKNMVNEFSIVYFEDPISSNDIPGWKKMFEEFSQKTLICGDDLVSSDPFKLQEALNENIINAVSIKPNQIGTVTEALAVAEIARFKNLKIVVSSRSGETDDNFIADFAAAVECDYVKFGAPIRERVTKYNRLTEIEIEQKANS